MLVHRFRCYFITKHVGAWAPVAYFSQATNDAESKYHSYELEMLVVVKSVERFHIYLYDLDFTDNRLLCFDLCHE